MPRAFHMLGVLWATPMAEARADRLPSSVAARSRAFMGRDLSYHARDSEANTTVMQGEGEITGVTPLSARLIQARVRLGLSQTDLAQRAGVSQGTIGNIEAGIRKQPRELLAIAAAVGVRPEWLKDGTPPMETAATLGAVLERWPTTKAREASGLLQANDPAALAHAVSQSEPIIALQEVTWEGLVAAKLDEPFQMRIPGDELVPVAYRGEMGRFRPGATPRHGKGVLLRDRSGAYHLRLYRDGIGGNWEGYSETPGVKTLERDAHGVEIVAPMTGIDWG